MNEEDIKALLPTIDKMSKSEQKALLKAIRQHEEDSIKNVYIKYVTHVHRGNWIAGKHLKHLCSKIELLLKGELYNGKDKVRILVVSMPPQHGKSMCLTETLPSWIVGNDPSKRVIIVSYNTDFARKFGRRNISKIKEFGKDLFGLELSKEQDDEIEIKGNTGAIISRGIMSGITGNPAEVIIIDDPVKNREEADSKTYRDKMWDEYLNSVKTRLSANGVIIVIETRWHEDDLAGRIIQNEGKKVLEINFPCEAEDGDILGRNKGDSLFPEIGKDKEWLEDFKRSYVSKEGNRTWLSLFQGRPTAEQGNIIKRQWFQYYDILPTMQQVIMSVDATFKDGAKNDFVCIQVWGKSKANMYLIDNLNARLDFPATLQAIRNMKDKHKNITCILVEDKANGSAIISMLKTEIGGIIPVLPLGGKESRVNAIAPQIEAGNVYLPNKTEWVYDFVEQCAAFPISKNDDMVDAMSQALNRLAFVKFSESKPRPKGFYTPSELEDLGYKTNSIRKVK